MGGSVKAEGLGDGCTASKQRHRQAAIDDATRLRPDAFNTNWAIKGRMT